MNFIINCTKGIAIGAGAILPGISSGVFCVIFGIYEKLIDSILNLFKDFKNNFKFLFPILLGVGIGIILFGNILNYCLYEFPTQTKSIFIGLILGSIPNLFKQVHLKESFKPSNIIFLLLTLLIGIGCIFLENYLPIHTLENISFAYLVVCGIFMSIRNCISRS